ncbi:XRE family transcriptional regulator [Pseudomonas cavernicola]|uniref:XRE family transcriptional regulator n=1 Tax=Pseudomonas cavernicola TaxID=2320866 RepID=A0A418XEL9_9PSED|nr:helix-turn-helix transcriptional regulator [Pseudomonas cavernicola]RJG10955.1 XRE family transcriptional regulator [Pseudomonas cavernicola]
MSDYLTSWIDESEENRKEFRRQELILEVAELICNRMEERDINRTSLSKILEKSTSYITQLLTGSRNMTLATLSDLALALESKVKIELVDEHAAADWETFYSDSVSRIHPSKGVDACNDYAFTINKVVPVRDLSYEAA